MALARAWALVKSMVAAHSVPSTALRRCSSINWASRLLAHWRARLDVVLLAAQCRSIGHGSTLAAPPGRLPVGQGGAPYLAEVSQSTL
jgi:hypothetical protein